MTIRETLIKILEEQWQPLIALQIQHFNKENGYGTYISKLDPGTKTIPHTHLGFEEFLILEGELIDSDGTVFQKGNFVTFAPGSEHSSYTKKGCLILTFMRGINEPSKEK